MNAEPTDIALAEPAISKRSLSDQVRDMAMLAEVSISVWSGEKSDPRIMEAAKAQAGASGNVGRAIKNLLAGHDAPLKATRAAFHEVRTTHYNLTLPWVADPHAVRERGPRLLANQHALRYIGTMGDLIKKAKLARDAFVLDYPDLCAKAKINLGGLVTDADYPDTTVVSNSFRASFDFAPIPDGAHFRGLPDNLIGAISNKIERKQAIMVQSATNAMWATVRERVEHLRDRLADPENRFKANTVEAVRELGGLVRGWNIVQDPRADEIAEDISRMLGGVDADGVRKSDALRRDVSEQASGVIDKLAAWGL